MKKIHILLSFLICSVSVFGQFPVTQNIGAPNTLVKGRGGIGVDSGFVHLTSFSDTSVANLGFLDNIPGITIRTINKLWMRSNDATVWIETGAGSLNVDTTNSVILRGTGSLSDPLIADLIVSPTPGNQIQVLPNGVYSTTAAQVQNGLISGGLVIWETGLTYTVTSAIYAIGGVIYTSPETLITLDNADPTDNRIDGFVVTTSSTAIDLTGTPSSDPANPSFDPATQLPLTFVLVTAAETEPDYCRDSIYFPNNGQNWTMTVSNVGRINTTSTNNPYSVTQDVEFTAAQNGDQLRAAKGTTISFGTYSVMALKIRSKATWASTSYVSIQAYNGITPVGNPIYIGDNTPYAFNSSNTAGYQTVIAPIGNLGVTTGATDLLLSIVTISGNTIGFYLDDWQLLGCDGSPIPTTGSFWSVNGNTQGTTLYGGTRDNFPTQIVVNNLNHTQFQQGGSTWMQGATPRISFHLGNGASGDYFISKVGTVLTLGTPGGYALTYTGNQINTFTAADGFRWNNTTGTFEMQLNNSGNLLLGSSTDNANTIFNINSTTKGSHPAPSMTAVQMNAIVTPLTGDLVFNSTAGLHYYYTGAVWLPLSQVVIASNGLTITSNDVELGGTALERNTTIPTSAFNLTINSSSSSGTLTSVATGSGPALTGTATGGLYAVGGQSTANGGSGVYGESTNNGYGVRGEGPNGVYGKSTSSYGVVAETERSSTNTIATALSINRTTTGTAANGIGGSIDFLVQSSTGLVPVSSRIMVDYTDATSVTRTSRLQFQTINSASLATRFTIAGDGALKANSYGVAAFTGTPTYALAVDADGDIIEVALGSGMTNPMTTAGDIIYSSDGSGTPARLGIGTVGQVLTVVAGLPAWVTTAGTGTVTSVSGASTGIFSYTGSPITTTGTLTLVATGTSGAVPYFSDATTLTSSAVWAANALVIGGGAGVAPSTTTTGTGVLTALGVNVGSAGAFVTFNGALGTPSSGTATNLTGLPLTTGVTGTLADDNGGTGQSTYTTGDILWASAANTLSKLAMGTASQVLRVNAGATGLEWATIAGAGTVTSVTLTQPAAGITITNSGVAITGAGTRTFALANDLLAVENLATTGIVRRTGTSTWSAGTLVNLSTEIQSTLGTANGGTGQVTYTNGQLLIGNTSGSTLTKATLTGTANQINITNGNGSITLSHAFNPTVQTLTSGATITWNVTNGANSELTLNATGATLSITNPIAGYTYTLVVTQGAGGSRTITTWPTGTRWTGGTAPTLSTTAGQRDVVSFYYNGSNYYGTFLPNMN